VTPRRQRRARGQILVAMTLCMGLFLMSLFMLVSDGAELYATSTRIQAAAQSAAQSAANDIDPSSLYFPGSSSASSSSFCDPYSTSCTPQDRQPQLRTNWKMTCENHARSSASGLGQFVSSTPNCEQVAGSNGLPWTIHVVIRKRVSVPIAIIVGSVTVEAVANAVPVRGASTPFG
jgi:uncharacterized membrane protein